MTALKSLRPLSDKEAFTLFPNCHLAKAKHHTVTTSKRGGHYLEKID